MSFNYSYMPNGTSSAQKEEVPELLQADVLKYCVCQYCKCYANVTPVRLVNNKIACGRCLSPGDGVQLPIVEALMKTHTFPCRYEPHGCKVALPFSTVDSHEKSCEFKKVICTIDECDWAGAQNYIQMHFAEKHAQHIVDGKSPITINIHETKTSNFLYSKKVPYLVRIICDGNSIKYSVKSFCAVPKALQLTYDIKFSANDRDLTFNCQRVQSYDCDDEAGDDKVPVSLLLTVLGEVSDVKVHIFIKTNTIGNTEMISIDDFKCPVCYDPMLGQIFVWRCGHSMCGMCSFTQQMRSCPVCHREAYTYESGFNTKHCKRKDNGVARNYALEKIIQKSHTMI